MHGNDSERSSDPGDRPVALRAAGSLPLPESFGRLARGLSRAAVAAAFWFAVVVPLAVLVVLAGGLDRPTDVATFLVLVGIEGAALVAGRGYAAPEARDD